MVSTFKVFNIEQFLKKNSIKSKLSFLEKIRLVLAIVGKFFDGWISWR
jgi:hypothetical protein